MEDGVDEQIIEFQCSVSTLYFGYVSKEGGNSDYSSQFYVPDAKFGDLVSFNTADEKFDRLNGLRKSGKALSLSEMGASDNITSLRITSYGSETDVKFTFGGYSQSEILSEIVKLADLKFINQFVYNSNNSDPFHRSDYKAWVQELSNAKCTTVFFLDVNGDGKDELVVSPVLCNSDFEYKFFDDDNMQIYFIVEESDDGIRLVYQGMSEYLFFVTDADPKDDMFQSGDKPLVIVPIIVKDSYTDRTLLPPWGAATVLSYKNGGYNFAK